MCSFRGSFSGAAKNVAKLETFSESAKFFAIFFFAFAVSATSRRVSCLMAQRPQKRSGGGGNLRSPKASAKLGIPTVPSKFFKRNFQENMLYNMFSKPNPPPSILTGSRLQQKKIFWQKREKKRGNQREERSRRKGRRRERTRSGVIRA